MTPALSSRHFIKERIVATGDWTALSVVHLGGDTPFDQNADMSLARDGGENIYIPGSSIVGALRSYLARHLATNRNDKEDAATAALFGRSLGEYRNQPGPKPAGYASLIRAAEARLASQSPAYIRDNVRIDAESGTAEDKGKFNIEVLPAGARFPFELTLSLYDEPIPGVDDAAIRECFRRALESFHDGGVRLGARTRQGFGRGKVENWTIRRFDMLNREHALDWLKNTGASGGETWTLTKLGGTKLESQRKVLKITASLCVKTSLLIRAGGGPGSPDSTQFRENGNSLVPGTSLRGVLRHRCERIARTLWKKTSTWDNIQPVNDLFGVAGEGVKTPRAGHILIEECALTNGELNVQSRVAIDRFTASALDAKLFDEAPFWPSSGERENLKLSIELTDPDPSYIVLILAALKDLWTGDLTIGGGAGIGRGVCQGLAATIQYTGLPDLVWNAQGKVSGWNDEWKDVYEEGVRRHA